jgi:hypothetical protein
MCAVIASCFVAAPALAQQRVSKLNERVVEKFIQKTADITKGKSGEIMDPAVIEKYLNDHLHEDARFKTTMTYNIPGYPSQESSLSLNKEDFINSVKEGAGTVQSYDNDIKINSITISNDEKAATVSTTSSETGTIQIGDGTGGAQDVPMIGVSNCTQILKLNKKRVLQMYNAVCKTEIQFEQGDTPF